MTTSQFRIDARPDGTGRIFVDEEDLSSIVSGLSLDVDPTDGTVLTLQFRPGMGRVTASGKVLQLTEGMPAQALVDRLDPPSLEAAVNERLGKDADSVGEAIVLVLRDLVDELNADGE